MPLKFFLNIDHNSAGQIDERGRCIVRQSERVSGEFSLLKASIFNSFNKIDKDYVRAIPYPRAREYLFQEYLSSYPPVGEGEEYQIDVVAEQIHQRCIDEWLGFAAMIALRQVYGVEIIKKRIDKSKFSGIGKTLYESNSNMLSHGKKPDSLSENAAGNDYIIYIRTPMEDIPVGMINPYLIFTPGYWSDKIKDRYPWTDGRKFINPLEKLTRGEKMILYRWLDNAKRICRGFQYVISLFNELINSIELTANDITLLAGTAMKTEPWADASYLPMEVLLSYVDLHSFAVSEYRKANMVNGIVFNISDEKISVGHKNLKLVRGFLDNELLIEAYERFSGDKKKIELFTDMFSYRNCNEILMVENDLSQHLENYIDTKWVLSFSIEKLKDNCRISKNMICNDKCYVLVPSGTFSTERKKKPEIVEKILSMIKIIEEGEDVYLLYQFSSTVPPRKLKFNYVEDLDKYKSQQTFFNAPTSYIWPNIKESAKYYMICSRIKANEGYLIFAPQGYSPNGIKEHHYYEMSEWPSYLEVYQMENSTYKLKGMVPVDQPDAAQSQSPIAVYSVDFGTSSTNVGVKVNIPKVNEFPPQTMMITETEDYTSFNNKSQFFYGDYKVASPFPTLYYENRIGSGNFSDGHAYFMETNRVLDIRDNKIKSDIKFGQNNEDRIKYIRSLLNYIFTDARKAGFSKIKLMISYSFSMPNVEIFQKSVKAAIEGINPYKTYGIELEPTEFISESVAALKYVRHTKRTNEIVVIDIGGGSVDVCIHSPQKKDGDAPLRMASFQHGSRHFFISNFKYNKYLLPKMLAKLNNASRVGKIESFYTNPDEFEEKVLKDIWKESEKKNDNGMNKYGINPEAYIENLLALNINEKGEYVNLGEELKNTFLSWNEKIKKYYQTMWMFQMSAIMFYCAMMTAEMQEKRDNQLFATVDIILAGKGSKIIGWLPRGSLDKLKNLYEKTFNSYNLGTKPRCSIDFDEKSAKNEGVLGMLYNHLDLAGKTGFSEQDIMTGHIRGEQNKKGTAGSEIEVVSPGSSDIDSNLPVYTKFLKIFKSISGGDFYEIEMKNVAESSVNEAENKIVIDKREITGAVNNYVHQKQGVSVFLIITEKIISQMNELGGERFD